MTSTIHFLTATGATCGSSVQWYMQPGSLEYFCGVFSQIFISYLVLLVSSTGSFREANKQTLLIHVSLLSLPLQLPRSYSFLLKLISKGLYLLLPLFPLHSLSDFPWSSCTSLLKVTSGLHAAKPKGQFSTPYGEPLAKFISCCLWRHFLVLFSRNHILSGFPPTAWALLLNLLSGLLLTFQLLKVGVA